MADNLSNQEKLRRGIAQSLAYMPPVDNQGRRLDHGARRFHYDDANRLVDVSDDTDDDTATDG
jgi:hypothetical protein